MLILRARAQGEQAAAAAGLQQLFLICTPSMSHPHACARARRASKRLLLLDYDGTLVPVNHINSAPSEELLAVLRALCADGRNAVYIISGRRKAELAAWFATVVRVVRAVEP